MTRKVRFFTLLELLAVIAIISILTGIGVGVYSYAMNSSRESATRSTMKQIETALEGVKLKYGYYPPADDASDGRIYIGKADGTLPSMPADGKPSQIIRDVNRQMKVREDSLYMADFIRQLDVEKLRDQTRDDGDGYLCLTDAWGAPIRYVCPGRINIESYDLISAGQDGVFGKDGDADLKDNYKSDYFRDDAGDMACDDLTNF